jgi:hypothetical protein
MNELFHHGDLTLRRNLEGGIWNRGEQLDSLPVSHPELRRFADGSGIHGSFITLIFSHVYVRLRRNSQHEIFESASAMLVVVELVEAGTGRSK